MKPNANSRVLMVFCLALLCFVVLPAAAAYAQQAPLNQAPPQGGPEVKINQAALEKGGAEGDEAVAESTILELIVKSGWVGWVFMAVLGVFSMVAVTIAIERLANLTRQKTIPSEFVGRLRDMVERREKEPGAFKQLCEQFTAPIAAIFKAALLRAGRPLPEMEKSMEDAASREIAALRTRVRPLNVIGGVAPLVGLLGTVVGMIFAFQTASTEGTGGEKAELLAEGIYLALLTTAAGLSIAIPAMLLAAYFNTRVERFMREIDEQLMEAMPCLALMESTNPHAVEAQPSKPQAAVAVT